MAEAWANLGSDLASVAVYAVATMGAVTAATAAARLLAGLGRDLHPVRMGLPLLAFAFTLQATVPAGASKRRTTIPPRPAAAAPPPWSGSEGSSSPPLPARTAERPTPKPWSSDSQSHGSYVRSKERDGASHADSHPAIHGKSNGKVTPLFPRAPRKAPDPEIRRREREEAMRRHPAGKGLQAADAAEPRGPSEPAAANYRVEEGDTLWAIAERHLGTRDVRRIARYWPLIHRANRSLIVDPNLIQPGWSLVLPPEIP
jgi:LysM repeat protein